MIHFFKQQLLQERSIIFNAKLLNYPWHNRNEIKRNLMTFKEIIAAEVGNRADYAATQAPKWEATVKEVEAKLQKDYARTVVAQPAKNSLRQIVGQSGKDYGIGVYLDSTLLDNLSEDERMEMVKEYVKELGGSVFTAYDKDGNAVDVHLVEWSKKFKNKSGRIVNVNKDLTSYLKNEVKQEAIALVDELVLASTYDGPEPATHPHDWVDNNGQNDWDVWTTYIQDKKTPSGRQNYELPIPQTVRKSCMIFIQ